MPKKLNLPWGTTIRLRAGAADHKERVRLREVWEPVAVVVSTLTAAIALWQTFILNDQLTAGDRNRSIQTTLEATQKFCSAIRNVPPDWETWLSATGWVALNDARRNYSDAFAITSVWLERDRSETENIVARWIFLATQQMTDATEVDFEKHWHSVYGALPVCDTAYQMLANSLTGKQVYQISELYQAAVVDPGAKLDW